MLSHSYFLEIYHIFYEFVGGHQALCTTYNKRAKLITQSFTFARYAPIFFSYAFIRRLIWNISNQSFVSQSHCIKINTVTV